MAYTLNGIGTWYWGKKNIHTNIGTCDACKSSGNFRSFDATKYFVFLHIPIIRLGRQRVIDECPKCQTHREISLKIWDENKRKDIASVISELRNDPNNPEKAKKALGAIVTYQDEEAFQLLADEISHALAENAEMQGLLGMAYTYFNNLKAAEVAYRASLSIQTDAIIQEKLAIILIKQLRPDDARPHLEHIFTDYLRDKAGYLYMLVEAYQYHGLHRSALLILNEMLRCFPDLETDWEFCDYLQISKRYEDSHKKINPRNLILSDQSRKGILHFFLELLPPLIGPAILAVAFAFSPALSYIVPKERQIYFVNGLSQSYQVKINNSIKKLPAQSLILLKMKEGEVNVQVMDKVLGIPDQTYSARTSFWHRLIGSNNAFVFNPDQSALIAWEQIRFSPGKTTGEKLPNRYLVGKSFYHIHNIDYCFIPLEAEVPKLLNKTVIKTSLNQITIASPEEILAHIDTDLETTEKLNYIKRMLHYYPEEELFLNYLAEWSDSQEVIDFLRTRLNDLPVLVKWHQIYQDLMTENYPDVDLLKEYRTYLNKNPNNSNFTYLLARLMTDPILADKLYKQALNSSNPSAYALNYMANRELDAGNTNEALNLAEKAINRAPNQQIFMDTRIAILNAIGRYNEILAENEAAQTNSPLNIRLATERVRILLRKGNPENARRTINDYCNRLSKVDPAKVSASRNYLEAIYWYSAGKEEQFVKLAEICEEDELRFAVAFSNNDYGLGSSLLANINTSTQLYTRYYQISNLFLLYIGNKLTNNPLAAAASLRKAASDLTTGNKAERELAKSLFTKTPPELYVISELAAKPEEKRIIFTALGLIFPEQEKQFFKAAGRLNFDTSFPYFYLKEVLKGNYSTNKTNRNRNRNNNNAQKPSKTSKPKQVLSSPKATPRIKLQNLQPTPVEPEEIINQPQNDPMPTLEREPANSEIE